MINICNQNYIIRKVLVIMAVKTEFRIKSCDGKNNLFVRQWSPENINNDSIKGILQISHGMAEHIDRYDEFGSFIADNGYVVVGNEHLGHGRSVCKEDWGYIADENPSEMMVRDLHQVTEYMRRLFPNKKIILLGHSMGSFLARRYLTIYGNELYKSIIMGTGSQPAVTLCLGLMAVNVISAFKGKRYKSDFIDKLMFGKYNDGFGEKRGSNWITKDKERLDDYMITPECGFMFTLNGVKMILNTIKYDQKRSNIEKIPKNLPVLFVSGKDDPVGNYGKGVFRAYDEFVLSGMSDVSIKLYENDRHEVLNETDRHEVYKDILNFLNK